MGACIACCKSTTHLTCCSILSLLGVLFNLAFFLIVSYQIEYIDFEIRNPEGTKGSCLIAMGFYLVFFVAVRFCLWRRQKEQAQASLNKDKDYRGLQQQDVYTERRIMRQG